MKGSLWSGYGDNYFNTISTQQVPSVRADEKKNVRLMWLANRGYEKECCQAGFVAGFAFDNSSVSCDTRNMGFPRNGREHVGVAFVSK